MEFDYLSRSKNFIFPLQQENIAMIQMFTENGQVKQTKINDKDKLIKQLDNLTEKMNSYTFEKEQLAVMIEILETHNTNQKPIKVKSNNFEDMVKSINLI